VGSNPTPPVTAEPRTLLLALFEDFVAIVVANVFKACLDKLAVSSSVQAEVPKEASPVSDC